MTMVRSNSATNLLPFYWRGTLRPYWGQAVWVFVFTLGSAALDTTTVGLAVPLLDALTAPQAAAHNAVVTGLSKMLAIIGFSTTSNVIVLVLLGVACVLFVVRSGLAVLAQYVTVGIAMKLRRSVKLKLSDRFLRAPYEEVSRQARGRVVHHINNPAETIYVAMVNLGHLIAGTFECILLVGLMLCLSWWTTLLIGLLAIGGVYGRS